METFLNITTLNRGCTMSNEGPSCLPASRPEEISFLLCYLYTLPLSFLFFYPVVLFFPFSLFSFLFFHFLSHSSTFFSSLLSSSFLLLYLHSAFPCLCLCLSISFDHSQFPSSTFLLLFALILSIALLLFKDLNLI